uniref:Uncharacterized protein n=1 Tax=Oreochromis niloticus TaxID=8128 RepID=A0A669BNM6_ORENI
MLVNVFLYIAPLCFTLQGQQSHRMVIFAAILILMTLFILYSSNNNSSIDAVYASFHVATNHATKTTDLRKWTGKDGYVPVYGNKSMTMHCHECALVTSSSHVLGSRAGDEIDRTECVIRMNDALRRVVAHSSVFRVVRRPNEFLRHTDNWERCQRNLYRLIQRVSMTYRDFSCFTVTPSKMRRFDSLFQRETGHKSLTRG